MLSQKVCGNPACTCMLKGVGTYTPKHEFGHWTSYCTTTPLVLSKVTVLYSDRTLSFTIVCRNCKGGNPISSSWGWHVWHQTSAGACPDLAERLAAIGQAAPQRQTPLWHHHQVRCYADERFVLWSVLLFWFRFWFLFSFTAWILSHFVYMYKSCLMAFVLVFISILVYLVVQFFFVCFIWEGGRGGGDIRHNNFFKWCASSCHIPGGEWHHSSCGERGGGGRVGQ